MGVSVIYGDTPSSDIQSKVDATPSTRKKNPNVHQVGGEFLEGEFLEGEFFWGPLLMEKQEPKLRPKNSAPKFGRPNLVRFRTNSCVRTSFLANRAFVPRSGCFDENGENDDKNKGIAPQTPENDKNDETGGCHGKLTRVNFVFLTQLQGPPNPKNLSRLLLGNKHQTLKQPRNQ